MKKNALFVFLALHIIPAFSQDYLSAYIDTGLNNNLVLKEKNLSLEQSMVSLKNAETYFLPSISFLTDYLSAEGGRMITLPTGVLLNPVYATLNQLTSSQKFSPVPNENAQLLPNNFYDARFHITYPLVNTELHYNRQISRQQVIMQEYEADIYRQELIRDIRQAYYNYCAASEAVNIYRDALVLVDQNWKVNQSLLRNGKGLPANLLRVEGDQQGIAAKIIESDNTRYNARNYFNFLLNRALTDTVMMAPEGSHSPVTLSGQLTEAPVTGERGELRQLAAGIILSDTRLKENKSYYIPKVDTYLDLGSQSSDFKYNSSSRYYFFGAQLSVPVFTGGRNRNTIRQAQLDLESLRLRKDHLARQLEMSAVMAQNNLASAWAACQASEKQLVAAKAYFNLIEKGFREGANSLLEFMDARNQLTTASLQLNINRYKVLFQMAEYERQTAVSKIK